MSSTSVTTVIELGDEASPFMLPGMAAPEQLTIDAGSRVVRFDRQCVLIPEIPKQKRSMVVTRAYSLPLWKRRGRQSEFEVPEESTDPSTSSPSPENTRIIIKVPIPTFRRRSSRSPPRGRSISTSPTMPNRLTPCLVHREPSTSPEIPSKGPSRPSLPIYHRRQNDITVPLRECCQACERITEDCIKEGDLWKEQFSRGARRRRSVSLDQHDSLTKMHFTHIKSTSCAKMYSTVITEDEALMDAEPRCKISLTVDEVDKRRKSFDFAADRGRRHDQGSPPSPRPSSSFNSHERDASSSSTSSSLSHSDELIPDILDSRHCLRASPIEEEDEAELFPLPRRTPSATPSPKASPSPSPNGSTSHLPSSVVGLKLAAVCSSRESVASRDSSSHEGLLNASLSRKFPGGVGLGFPPATLQTSAKGSPFTATSAASMALSMSRPLPPLPNLPDTDSGSSSSSNDNAKGSSFPSITISDANSTSSAPSSSPSTHLEQPPICAASPIRAPPSSMSPSLPRNTHQPSSSVRRKLSFTAPFVKAGETIKGVGVDVLKGVSSIGATGAPF